MENNLDLKDKKILFELDTNSRQSFNEIAKKKIEIENPELVLLDIIYPEGQDVGFKAALDIKKLRPELPVFAFSALNRDYSFEFKKEDARVDEFVVKPINLKKLVDMINKYLE